MYYVLTDANKNVCALVSESGEVVAKYDYTPFGKLLTRCLTPNVRSLKNSFLFSSEYHDEETGLVYYNYRYYNPELGRWMSQDPIGERGGLNLYGMVNNNPVGNWDYLGFIEELSLSYDLLQENSANGIIDDFNNFGDMLDDISSKTSDGKCACVKNLRIGSHGGHSGIISTDNVEISYPAYLAFEGAVNLLRSTFSPHAVGKSEKRSRSLNTINQRTPQIIKQTQLLVRLNDLLCEDATVEFIACSAFSSENFPKYLGSFLTNAEKLIGYNVMLGWNSGARPIGLSIGFIPYDEVELRPPMLNGKLAEKARKIIYNNRTGTFTEEEML
jgi:RHS repeat-associated protein